MKHTKNNPLRVFEAFGGYGSQSLALKRLKRDYPGFCYKIVGYSDIEPTAIKAYMALHEGENIPNYGDISKIEWDTVPDFDLFTYSFPCTDISAAGKQEGFAQGSGTRSSLLWECEKAIQAKHPRYLMMENVKALVQRKFIADFHKWLEVLESEGYYTAWQILNAKNYGVPQNRERVFAISILKTQEEPEPRYFFPSPFPLERRLKDVLEDKVDEKYYLSDKMLEYFNRVTEDKTHNHNFNPQDGGGTACAIKTTSGSRVEDNFLME